MASPGTPNLPGQLQRSISIREAKTTDGFTVFANKHDTYRIQEGTLNDAIENNYIDAHDAMLARTAKARRIAREILANLQRPPDVQNETKKHEAIDRAKSADDANEVKGADKDAGDECKSEDADSSEGDSSTDEDNQ